jgi:Carboxypeptidase regulatory-like domain
MKRGSPFILALVLGLTAATVMAQDGSKAKVFKVSGFVGKSSSEAAPGVSVILLRGDTEEVFATDQTNFFGKYTIKNVPPGVYVLRVEKIRRTVAVKDKNVRLDIDLSADTGVMDYTKTGLEAVKKEGESKAEGGAAGGAQGGAPGEPPGPTDARLMNEMAGEYYHFSGSTEKRIMFCPQGTFFDSSESSYSGRGVDGLGNEAMAWGQASENKGSGQWSIQGNLQSGTITLAYRSGKRVVIPYVAGPEKGCFKFDGTVFCYSGPAKCK